MEETTRQTGYVVIAVGDGAVEALAGSEALMGGVASSIVLASSSREVAQRLSHIAAAHPERVRVVELEAPAGTGAKWDEAAALAPAQRALRFDDAGRYTGGAAGASSRADAFMRLLCSARFDKALESASNRAHANPQHAERLTVIYVVVASAYRMTGSGALGLLLAKLEEHLLTYEGQADHSVDMVLATRSVNLEGTARHLAVQGRRAALAEVELVLRGRLDIVGAEVLWPGRVSLPHLHHVYEVGAPVGAGMLENPEEASRALRLAVEAVVVGGTASEVEAERPHSHQAAHRPDGARAAFGGLGALEVAYDQPTARRALTEHMLAGLVPPFDVTTTGK